MQFDYLYSLRSFGDVSRVLAKIGDISDKFAVVPLLSIIDCFCKSYAKCNRPLCAKSKP